MPPEAHLTTPIVWLCTSILVLMDALLGLLLRRFIHRELFVKIGVLLPLASGLFFLAVWTVAMVWAWDWFYVYIFPAWARFFLPPIFFIIYLFVAWLMFWLSRRLPFNPALTWCFLGGVEGLLSHLYAIYGLGAASLPPIMQGTSSLAVLIFAVFEKAFYWSIVLLTSGLIIMRSPHSTIRKPYGSN